VISYGRPKALSRKPKASMGVWEYGSMGVWKYRL
jgi:hypothetical protein